MTCTRLLCLAAIIPAITCEARAQLPALTEVKVISTLDGESQPVLYWAPDSATQQPTVLFVFLHSWSSDYKQDNSKWQREAVKRGWIYLHANFRGANKSPKACGSRFARRDILDAMDFANQKFNVDKSRVYLAGVSGGGHMAMLMAGHHPDRFSAVSAWVGISDLPEWYRFHVKDGRPQRDAQMILKSFGGPPGADA
ncbi:MAG: prolyl oligopeptidase family serine peptidase, partial [Fuerstiella sp.]|nr:prolyl oligopeptidase family serine peptidase [Fuerstiella sp.]